MVQWAKIGKAFFNDGFPGRPSFSTSLICPKLFNKENYIEENFQNHLRQFKTSSIMLTLKLKIPEQILPCSHETACQQNVKCNHKGLDIVMQDKQYDKTCAIGFTSTRYDFASFL